MLPLMNMHRLENDENEYKARRVLPTPFQVMKREQQDKRRFDDLDLPPTDWENASSDFGSNIYPALAKPPKQK